MAVRLDAFGQPSRWYRVPDGLGAELVANLTELAENEVVEDLLDSAFSDWLDDQDPEPPTVDELDDLSLGEALEMASVYGGGEFDGEMGDIVSALCVLRDHITTNRAATS